MFNNFFGKLTSKNKNEITNFESFMKFFKVEDNVEYTGDLYEDFISNFGGKSFGYGLFRTFSKDALPKWTEMVGEAYPTLKNDFKLFGYDWLGRCFGVDLRKKNSGNVLMFEIGTNDVLEIPCKFGNFLNEEIPECSEACLATSFYLEWQENANVDDIQFDKCVGYKVPLFIGGEDDVDNLELSDMEVYWDIIIQILKKI